jgi:hypothetical protein
VKLRATTAALFASLFLLEANGVAQATGPWRANQENTRGWMLMSPEERIAHQAKIRGFTNYEDCHAYQLAHHQLMQERAARLGLKLPERGRDACAHLRPSPDPRN